MSEKEQLERLCKWFRYQPPHRNLLSFLEKPFDELTAPQMNLLFEIQKEIQLAKLIQKYLENKHHCTKDEQTIIHQLLNQDTLTTVVEQKMTTKDHLIAQNQSEEQRHKIKRKPIQQRTILEDYILILYDQQKKSPNRSLKPHKKCARKY